MARKSRFRVVGQFDKGGAGVATVTIDRDAMLFSVRPLRRKREYTLPLAEVARMTCWRIIVAERNEKARAKKKRRIGKR